MARCGGMTSSSSASCSARFAPPPRRGGGGYVREVPAAGAGGGAYARQQARRHEAPYAVSDRPMPPDVATALEARAIALVKPHSVVATLTRTPEERRQRWEAQKQAVADGKRQLREHLTRGGRSSASTSFGSGPSERSAASGRSRRASWMAGYNTETWFPFRDSEVQGNWPSNSPEKWYQQKLRLDLPQSREGEGCGRRPGRVRCGGASASKLSDKGQPSPLSGWAPATKRWNSLREPCTTEQRLETEAMPRAGSDPRQCVTTKWSPLNDATWRSD
mmetsp:Transcript_113475/g.326246  ORF Transcript_113475/g.326246 Transcript_113475/m.326246 type:complete len:276 (+) Transcript_113475:60-887(+)